MVVESEAREVRVECKRGHDEEGNNSGRHLS
jgi:hypothetical protein